MEFSAWTVPRLLRPGSQAGPVVSGSRFTSVVPGSRVNAVMRTSELVVV